MLKCRKSYGLKLSFIAIAGQLTISCVYAAETIKDLRFEVDKTKSVNDCIEQPRQPNGNPFVIHTSVPDGRFTNGVFDVIDNEQRFTFEVYCNSVQRKIAICNLGSTDGNPNTADTVVYGDPRVSNTVLIEGQCALGDYQWLRVQSISGSNTRVEYWILGS